MKGTFQRRACVTDDILRKEANADTTSRQCISKPELWFGYAGCWVKRRYAGVSQYSTAWKVNRPLAEMSSSTTYTGRRNGEEWQMTWRLACVCLRGSGYRYWRGHKSTVLLSVRSFVKYFAAGEYNQVHKGVQSYVLLPSKDLISIQELRRPWKWKPTRDTPTLLVWHTTCVPFVNEYVQQAQHGTFTYIRLWLDYLGLFFIPRFEV